MSLESGEIEQLEAGMAALEAQRGALGDAVVDAALISMRQRLAGLRAQARPAQQRKLATVLFADVSGFTALSETIDAEVVTATMNDLWALVDRAIVDHGGYIDKHIGDAVMALWGAEQSREDDPERAIRAALAMQVAVEDFCRSHGVPLAMRVGVNTGPVLLGAVGSTAEYTALGDAVNLASRLEHAAPVGSVLISHDTYRHIRGIFDVQSQAPLSVKGKAQPVQTYLVLRAKPRAFRLYTRGVEGVETRMVGREAELLALQAAYNDVLAGQPRLLTVVGEAGVGKSRLLYEFDNWLELRPERIRYFKGRATPNLQHVPFGLFRDLFAFRCQILDSDSTAVALEKFRAGVGGVLEAEQADVVGHWLGFDFSASEAVRRLRGSGDFSTVARAHLTRYFAALTATGPVVLLLEDAHWADNASLDLAAHLFAVMPATSLLVMVMTRPTLFERRADWPGERLAVTRIDLTPLTREASWALVDEILQRADNVPSELHNLIVDTAEGNPFYVEELIRMLMDQGVIERGAGERGGDHDSFSPATLPPGAPALEEAWQVRIDRLADLRVPATLTGLLQSRLDGLPGTEREALQRASVVGRLFWDSAVAELMAENRERVDPALEAIRQRQLIFVRETSSFAGCHEFTFRHALLRDVAYETVLLRHRAAFHGRVARWLVAHAGERVDEYLGLIAQHFALAGEPDPAADYFQRSGEHALRASTWREARAAFERALALRQESGAPPVASLPHLLGLGQACNRLSDHTTAEEAAQRALALARDSDDLEAQAEALLWLARTAEATGRVPDAAGYLNEALPLARAVGGPALVRALNALATSSWQNNDFEAAEEYAEEARQLAMALGDVSQEISSLRSLGVVTGMRQEFDRSIRYFQECLALARQIGDRFQEYLNETNLGVTQHYAGAYTEAVGHYRRSLAFSLELGMLDRAAIDAHNLADVHNTLGELDEARRYATQCLRLARQAGALPMQLAGLVTLADALARGGQAERALTLLGLVRQHPSTPPPKQRGIQEVLDMVTLEPAAAEAALAAGAALDVTTVVDEVLDGQW